MLSRIAIRRIAERICLWEFMGVLLAGWACGSATAGGELPVGWYADPWGGTVRPHGFTRMETPEGPALGFGAYPSNIVRRWDGTALEQIGQLPSSNYTFFVDWIDDGSGGAYYVGGISALYRLDPELPVATVHTSGVSNVAMFDSGTGVCPHFSGFRGVFRRQNGVTTALAAWNSNCAPAPIRVFDDGDGPALYAGGAFRFMTPTGGQSMRVDGLARYRNGSWAGVGSGVTGQSVCNLPMPWVMGEIERDGVTTLAIGGQFDTIDSLPYPDLALRRNGDWSPADFEALEVHEMRTIDLGSGPRLVVAGRFAVPGEAPFLGFISFDGADWTVLFDDLSSPWDIGSFATLDSPEGAHLYVAPFDGSAGSTRIRFAGRYGPICPDLDGSGTVDLADLAVVLADFGGQTQSDDSDNDGDMDLHDLALVLAGFGQSCTR